MGYSKKELKMYIRYLKRTIKILSKMDKWAWNPIGPCFHTIEDLTEQLKYYQGHLNNLKKGVE